MRTLFILLFASVTSLICAQENKFTIGLNGGPARINLRGDALGRELMQERAT